MSIYLSPTFLVILSRELSHVLEPKYMGYSVLFSVQSATAQKEKIPVFPELGTSGGLMAYFQSLHYKKKDTK